MNIKELEFALPYILKSGITPHIIGKHGIGKSSIVHQMAKKLGYDLVEIRLGQMSDAGDFLGLPKIVEENGKERTLFATPNWLPTKPNTILFLDEINRSSKDILQAIFQLILDKKIHQYELPENCHVIAASNPATEDYSVLDFSDSAFQDRFVHIKFEPTVDEFLNYGRAKELSEDVLGFISTQSELLDDPSLKDFDLSFVKPSRRAWEMVSKLEKTGLTGQVLTELTVGLTGSEATISYMSYKKTRIKPPTGLEVLTIYPNIKDKVLIAIKENRSDIIAKMNDEIVDVMSDIEKKESMTRQEAENLVAFITDIGDEHVVSLAQRLSTCVPTYRVEGLDDTVGLGNYPPFVDRVEKAFYNKTR